MNKRLKKLYADKRAAVARMEAILDENEDLSDELKAEFDGLKTQTETIQSRIQLEEDAERAKESLPAVEDINTETEAERKARISPSFSDVPDKPVSPMDYDASDIKIPARAIGLTRGLKCYKTAEAQKRAYAFGQFLRAMLGNGHALQWCQDRGISPQAVHNENTNTQGGYLVIPEFSRDIIDLTEEYGVFSRYARNVQMGSDVWKQSRKTGGLTMYAVGEGDAGTESTAAWDQIQLVRKDWMVLSRISNQLNQDAFISVVDFLATDVAKASAQKRDDAGFIGDGTSTYHGITGVRTKLSDVNGVDDGGGLVLCEASDNTWPEVTIDPFQTLLGRFPSYPGIRPAWHCTKEAWASIMLRLELAAGGNTIRHFEEGADRGPLFLGYPVVFNQSMNTATGASQIFCLFGDLSMSSTFGDRQETTIAFSDSANVNSQSVFERNQVAVRWTEAWDINNHDVGTATAAGPVMGIITTAS